MGSALALGSLGSTLAFALAAPLALARGLRAGFAPAGSGGTWPLAAEGTSAAGFGAGGRPRRLGLAVFSAFAAAFAEARLAGDEDPNKIGSNYQQCFDMMTLFLQLRF